MHNQICETIFVMDPQFNVIGILSNNGAFPNAPFFDDTYIQELATGAETYEFSTYSNAITSEILQLGNYIVFKYGNKYKLFQIMDNDDEHKEGQIITCYCEMAGLELLTDYCEPFSIEGNVQLFFNTVLQDTNWQLGGFSESLATNIQQVKIEKYTNVYKVIQENIETYGNIEIEFRVGFNGNAVTGFYIDVYENGYRGSKTYKRFEYGENVEGIKRNRNMYDFASAMIGTGKDGLTFKDIEWKKSDGKPADKPKGQDFIVDLGANERFNKRGKYIKSLYESDDTNPQDLLLHSWERLQEVKEPKFDYEVDLALTNTEFEEISIGDTNYVIDNDYNPPILLECRVGKLEISLTDSNKNKCTLSNYKEVASKIREPKDGEDGKTPEIGDNGNWFLGGFDTGKPSQGEQGLPGSDGEPAKYVRVTGEQVFKYGKGFIGTPIPSVITVSSSVIGITNPKRVWSYKTPTMSNYVNMSSTDASIVIMHNDTIWGTDKSITVRCSAGDKYDEITLVKVADGIDGTTTYTWVKYADDSSGNGLSDNPAGKSYVGFAYNKTTPAESTNKEDYTWSLIKGADGVAGTPGEDGTTYYTWIKYSDNANGNPCYDIPTSNTEYIGIAVNQTTATESTDYTKYTWSKFRGDDGLQGIQGPKGEQGIPGADGTNGKTSYFHIKYSAVANPTTSSQMTETPNTYIGTYVDFVEADSTDPSKYTWARFEGLQGNKGEQGIPGTNGADGKTTYLHIKYSNDGGKTFTSNNGETVGDYMGTCTDFNLNDPTSVSSYTWAKIRGQQGLQGVQGEKGEQGIPGSNGTNGKTSYFHIKYSAVSNPTDSSQMTEEPNTYIGTYVDFIEADSQDPTKYTWSRFEGLQGSKGEQGIPGVNGDNGKTTYLHIKYSNDGGKTFTANNGETVGDYIGTCTDYNSADPTTVGSYTWARIKGDQGQQGLQGIQGAKGDQGIPGTNGKTSYFHIKYAPVQNPTSAQMTETPNTFIGTYVDYEVTDSTDPSKYTWARFQGLQGSKGDQGIPGVNGADGKTSYLHIKYSNDGGVTFTANNGETPGDYIGQCTDFNLNDPVTVGAYKWSKVKGEPGIPGADGESAYTIVLSNENHTFPCQWNGNIPSAISTTIKVIALKGTKEITPTIGTLPTIPGLTLTKNGTTITVVANVGTSLAEHGSFDIPITVEGIGFAKTFTWSKSKAGANGSNGTDGSDGISPLGVTLAGQSLMKYLDKTTAPVPSTIVLKCKAMKGATEVTEKCSYQWQAYYNNTWNNIGTGSSTSIAYNSSYFLNLDILQIRVNATYGAETITLEHTISKVYDNKYISQQEIFDKLMENGNEFVYQDQGTGKIYINATYIKTGQFVADLIKGGILTLGGTGDNSLGDYGYMRVLNSAGTEEVAHLDGGEMWLDTLTCGNLIAENLDVGEINNSKMPTKLDSEVTVYVDETISDEQSSNVFEEGAVFNSFQGAMDAIPTNLNGHTATIKLRTDIHENIEIRGMNGGNVYFLLCKKNIYGNVYIVANSAKILMYGGMESSDSSTPYPTIKPSEFVSVASRMFSVCVATSPNVFFRYCNVYGKSDSSNKDLYYAIGTVDMGTAYLGNIKVIGSDNGVRASALGRAYVTETEGKVNNYAFRAVSGGDIRLNNTKQIGGGTNTATAAGSSIVYSTTGVTFDSSSSTGSNDNTTTVTKSVTIKSSLGDTYRSTVYNSWKKDNTVRQGDWGYGNCNGCWFFGSQFSELKGKTITKVVLKIKRNSNAGASGNVNHVIKMHNHSSRPGGMPSYLSGWSKTVAIAAGETKTITITDSAVLSAIKDGTMKGFGLQSSYSKSNYSACSGAVSASVTYK